MTDATLKTKLALWAELKKKIAPLASDLARLESDITQEVLSRGGSFHNGVAAAVYSEGRGSYNYQKAVTNCKKEAKIIAINEHSSIIVDWRKVCSALGIPMDHNSKYYTPGKPKVNVELVEA